MSRAQRNPEEEAEAMVEEAVETAEGISDFPEPVWTLIQAAAYGRIKKGAEYRCEEGHRFKGKDMAVVIEEEGNIIIARLACPECNSETIYIPKPAVVIDLSRTAP